MCFFCFRDFFGSLQFIQSTIIVFMYIERYYFRRILLFTYDFFVQFFFRHCCWCCLLLTLCCFCCCNSFGILCERTYLFICNAAGYLWCSFYFLWTKPNKLNDENIMVQCNNERMKANKNLREKKTEESTVYTVQYSWPIPVASCAQKIAKTTTKRSSSKDKNRQPFFTHYKIMLATEKKNVNARKKTITRNRAHKRNTHMHTPIKINIKISQPAATTTKVW